ncbi:MAG: hypothetical protein K2P79_00400, partial [Sphingomonas sp.]|nr:hypothetical protein [Sphingomonas sp.]
MRVVIDSNRMQSDELRMFLSMSSDNRAVLTDYTAMEAYKGNTLVSIQASWVVLRDFPKQVLILKGTKNAGLIDPRAPGIADRLVWKAETRAVPEYVRALDRAAAVEQFIIKQLLDRGQWARSHMEWMLARSGDMHLSIQEFAAVFTEAELARMRRKERWKRETAEKFFGLVNTMARISFNAHPGKPVLPARKHRFNHLLFRHAAAYAFYMLQLIQRGATTRKAEAVRNDAVDVVIATYATYFNGLMSEDNQASIIHHLVRFFLSEIGA